MWCRSCRAWFGVSASTHSDLWGAPRANNFHSSFPHAWSRQTALIIGYNRKRGEFILKFPGNDPGEQIFRMREEELSTSLFEIFYIPPS